MANLDFEVYDGKSFKDLCKEVVQRSESKKDQLDTLISDVRSLIKNSNDALVFMPRIKEFLEVGIKNDEQIVKLAAVVQRLQSAQVDSGGGDGSALSEEEKEELLKTIAKQDVTEIKKVVDNIDNILPLTSSLISK